MHRFQSRPFKCYYHTVHDSFLHEVRSFILSWILSEEDFLTRLEPQCAVTANSLHAK